MKDPVQFNAKLQSHLQIKVIGLKLKFIILQLGGEVGLILGPLPHFSGSSRV
jgi:hypothetical protein